MAMTDIIHVAFMTPMGKLFSHTNEESWGIPILFHGPPGGGKTSMWRRLARRYRTIKCPEGIPYECAKPGAKGEGWFGVTPAIVEDKELGIGMEYPSPIKLIRKFAPGVGILNVGELNTAAPALQAPLLGLIQERELGDYFFGPRIRVFGDCNSVDEAAGGWDIAPALANRMGHLDFSDPDIVKEWVPWLTGGANGDVDDPIDVDEVERTVMQAWPHQWAVTAGYVAGYLRRRPEHFRLQPAAHDPNASRAWSSPRTWEYATRAMTAAAILKLDESDTDELLCGLIGSTVALDFATYRKNEDLPDPALFLDGKVEFVHNIQRMDRTLAVLSSCSALVKPKECENRKERATSLWKFISAIAESAADLAAPIVQSLWDEKLVGIKEAKDVLALMEPVVNPTRGR